MNELANISNNELAAAAENGNLGELLKPLTQEIHLFDSFVAGTTHLADKTVLNEIAANDKLTLQREDNKFDSNAIMIFTMNGKKLGYVPEKDNLIFARLMDAGKLLCAKITSIEIRGTFHKIAIGIYLVDF
ncbi:MAG: HIRAN domain-containing protein [Clostridia bacterium]|nr:HIRAN domain-containing protein [Clostridia bacterium]